jgi:fatty acid desaturase
MKQKITDILSKQELQQLTKRSDAMGAWAIGSVWLMIVLTFALMAWSLGQANWIKIPTLILGVCLLGGRQLALAICTHEATHRTLFATRKFNDGLTDWLCARPIGLDLFKYRDHHFIHHSKTGTDEDSDISLIEGLPTTRISLLRKFSRDLLGITGLKFLFGRVLMDAELMKWTVATNVVWLPRRSFVHHVGRFLHNFMPTLIANIALLTVLVAFGYAQLYWAWLIAYLIPYPLFIRIRALAEHAVTERSLDMFRNTRTTRAGLLARLFVAPLHVNYHIEHHALASAPWHRLPGIHKLLRERHVVQAPPSYWQVMALVSAKQSNRG